MARLTRPITPLVLKSSTVRRLWFRGSAACHADRITAKRGVQIVDDYIECAVSAEIFSTDGEHIAPLDPCHAPSLWHGRRKTQSFPSPGTALMLVSACHRRRSNFSLTLGMTR